MMKRKIEIILCVAGILLFSAGIIGFRGNTHRGYRGEAAPAGLSEQAVPELTKQIRPERPEEVELNLWRVIFPKPTVILNGEEGELSYRWGDDFVLIDENTVLLSCDCYFAAEELQQKIFYLAEATDYVPREVFRQDVRRGHAEDEHIRDTIFPELLERRLHSLQPVHMSSAVEGSAETCQGYVYESDGKLYCLSADFQETVFICDIRELMGGLYEFSPWTAEDAICDVSADASRMLACTDQGLYEYDLKHGGETLLEPAVFLPHEIAHVEGDCDCGETGFAFSGPVAVEYTPDDQGYIFLEGNEYGDAESITLSSGSGEILYQKIWEDYKGGYKWLESGAAVYLAVFYRENESTWMDRTDIHTGETETFAVPDEVLREGCSCIAFIDENSLIYCSEYVPAFREQEGGWGESKYEIYLLYSGEIQDLKTTSPEEADWNLALLGLGGYETIIVRYPQTCSDITSDAGNGVGSVKNQPNPKQT